MKGIPLAPEKSTSYIQNRRLGG